MAAKVMVDHNGPQPHSALLRIAAKRSIAFLTPSPLHPFNRSSRSGMSLLELVLALALSVVLLGLIGNAIYFHLRTFQTRQDGVEQSLLARAILRHIADDLRCAVAYRPVDTKGLDAVSLDPTKLASSALGAGVDPALIANAAASKTSTSGNNAAKPQGANPAANQATEEPTTPEAGESYAAGFYGDPFSLQFEMTRLPRLDEYDPLFASDGSGDVLRIPADMRTISYHLQGEATAARSTEVAAGLAPKLNLMTQLATRDTSQPRGLVRSEQERSLAAAGVVSDSTDEANNAEQVLADEVTRLEFRYFDGYEWWPEWDSDDRGGLPFAVEIIVALANGSSAGGANGATTALTTTSTAVANETVYRMVVKIPTAQPLPMQEELSTEDESKVEGSAAASTSNAGGMP